MRESIRTVTLGVVLALTVLGTPSLSFADPIIAGSGWQSFSWTSAQGGLQTESAFTFTNAAPVTVKVTDAYVPGDRFSLSDNGSPVGLTSQVNGGPAGLWTDNPNVAFLNPAYSSGTFVLAAGVHTLLLTDIQSPNGFPGGAAFLRLDNGGNGGGGGVASVGSAPEPGTLALVGMSLAGLAVGRLRRRFRKSPEAAIA